MQLWIKDKLILIIAEVKLFQSIDSSLVNQWPHQMSTIGIYDWH